MTISARVRHRRALAAVAISCAAGLAPVGIRAAAIAPPPSTLSSAPAAPVSAGLPMAEDPNLAALQRIGACLSGGGKGDFLVVMDRSGSLKNTDPSGARIDAAKYLVEQWGSLATREKLNVNVAIAGFDIDFQKVADWTPASSTDALLGTLESLRSQNSGIETDYWNALSGVRRELSARGQEGGNRCAVAVWFTDGEYALQARRGAENSKAYAPDNSLVRQRDADAAVAAGKQDICRAGGVADQARSQGVVSLGVGLSGKDKPDFSFLSSVMTGSGGCGKITAPPPGSFFEVGSIRDLYFAFDRFAAPTVPPIVQQARVCTGSVCPAGTHRFVLDSSIGSVHILGDSDAKDHEMWLVPPTGDAIRLSKGATAPNHTFPGAKATWKWEGKDQGSVSLDMARTNDSAWSGPWGLAFTSPNGDGLTSRTSLRIYGDISPAWPASETTTLRSGERPELTFALVHADGSAADPTTLSPESTFSAKLILPDGSERPIVESARGGAISNPYGVDLSGLPTGPAVIRLSLAVTTKAWESAGAVVPGTKLETEAKDLQVKLQPPANYPVVPPTIDFGRVESAGSISRALALTGPGCAWLEGPAAVTTTPQNVTATTITSSAASKDSCVSGELPLNLTTTQTGNGLLAGTLKVMLLPDDRTAPALATSVAFNLDMKPPINTSRLWLVLSLLTLLGVAIPVGLLYAAKHATAKIPGDSVAHGYVTGVVNGSSSFLDSGVDLAAHDLAVSPVPDDRRSVSVGRATLRTRMGLGLTEPGYVVIEDLPGPSMSDNNHQVKGAAQLPLAVQGHWFASLDGADPRRGPVTVGFLTVPGPGQAWSELTADAQRRIRDVVGALRAALPRAEEPAAQAGPVDPFATVGTAATDPFAPGGAPAAPSGLGTPMSPTFGSGPSGATDPFGASAAPSSSQPATAPDSPGTHAPGFDTPRPPLTDW